MPGTLCLITDRRRLLAALGQPDADWASVLFDQIQGAVAGGVDLVQVREPDLPDRAVADFTRRLVALAGASALRIVVNDRVDVALAAGAHGVHLREAGVPPRRVRDLVDRINERERVDHRRMAPSFVVGRSVHSAAVAAASDGADYLIAGSVFETASKPGAGARLGLDGLEAVVRAAGSRPVLAVGGVTGDRVAALRARGVSGVAAIGAFIPAQQVLDLAITVQNLAKNLRLAFDTALGLS